MLKVSYRKQQSLSRRIWGSPPQAEHFGDLSLKNEDFVTKIRLQDPQKSVLFYEFFKILKHFEKTICDFEELPLIFDDLGKTKIFKIVKTKK